MAKIRFENGKTVNFEGTPTPEDVEFVAKQLGITASSAATPAPQPQQKTFLEKASNTLGDIFGGKIIGEAIGTGIAKARATDEEKQFIEKGPSAKQVIGDVGRVALNFIPAAKASSAIGVGTKALGLGKLAKPAANIITGTGVGYAGDVTSKLSEGQNKPFSMGVGTGVGAGLSTIPYVGRGLSKLGSEVLGVSTGTGAGTLRQFSSAIREGGDAATAAREGLRGKVAPDEVVDEAKSAFGQLLKNRSTAYEKQLSKLKLKNDTQIDHTPIVAKFNKMLEEFGVMVGPDGSADFSRAPGLGRYKTDLQNLSETLANWGTKEGDNTVLGIDKLKQVIDDFRIGSADSKKFDSFVTALRNESKNIIRNNLKQTKNLKTLGTYEKMLGDYEKSTKEIREIQRNLSLGDKASVDTAFRKLNSVFRTNNEMRKKAVEELNQLTGGTLLPKIAGQQLSEKLPRGLMRQLGGIGVGAGVITGVGIIPMLKVAMFSSPRVVGEMLNVLGIVGAKADLVKKELSQLAQQGALIGGTQNDQ